MKIIVVLPAYNAEKTLAQTYAAIPHECVAECVLVDDKSTDATVTLSQSLGIHTVSHADNRGYGGNQKTCYAAALERGADAVIMLPPDYQSDPIMIREIVRELRGGAEVVLVSRMRGRIALSYGMPFVKFIANRLLTTVQNVAFGTRFSEFHTGYRAYSRSFLESAPLNSFSENFLFDNEILVEALKQKRSMHELFAPARYHEDASSIKYTESVRYAWGVLLLTARSFRQIRQKKDQSR